MRYEVEIRPSALRDFARLSRDVARRIIAKLDAMRDDLRGDVKRLVGRQPAYRLRVGDYRVLFEIVGDTIVVWRVRHRSDAYN